MNLNNLENPPCGKMQKLSAMKRRERLSDISNTQSSRKLPGQENQNLGPIPPTKSYIADLLQENTALLGLLGEQTKIIEMNAAELQKLRISYRQIQVQNCQLAKANSLMLEELNLGKDRLKALQHELGCTAAVLKNTKLELQEKNKLIRIMADKINLKGSTAALDSVEEMETVAISSKRKFPAKHLSLGSVALVQEEPNRRTRKGRSSVTTSRIRSSTKPALPCNKEEDEDKQELEPADNENSDQNTEASVAVSKPDDDKQENSREPKEEPLSVSGRPQRRSTVGVSYKERPVNLKMRRA